MSNPAPQQSRLDCEPLKKLIREVPDFPKKGILFYDITTLLKDKLGLAMLIDALSEHYLEAGIDLVLGMEARGFIFAPGARLSAECRLRSRAQARQAARCHRQVRLRPGIRHQHSRDPQRRDPERPARADCR